MVMSWMCLLDQFDISATITGSVGGIVLWKFAGSLVRYHLWPDFGIVVHPSIPTRLSTLVQLYRLFSSMAKGLHRCRICWYLDVIPVSNKFGDGWWYHDEAYSATRVEQTKRLS